MIALGAKMTRHLALIAVVAAAACRGSDLPRQAVVSDSAGIRTVLYPDGLPEALPEWSLEPTPELVIGTGSNEQHQLYEVKGARLLSDGSVAVLNGGSHEIRIFDRSADPVTALGGEGEGPGEFTELETMLVLPGDSILAVQRVPYRVALFTRGGDLVRSDSPQRRIEAPFFDVNPLGYLSTEQAVVYAYPDYFSIEFEEGVNRPDYPLGVVDLWSGEVRHIGSTPGVEQIVLRVDRGIRQSIVPFGRSPDFAAAHGAIHLTTGNGFEVERWDGDGVLTDRLRVEAPPRDVLDSDLDRYVQETLAPFEEAGEAQLREWEQELRSFPIPTTMPLVRRIEVDALGNLWVEQYTPSPADPVRFWVFGPDGQVEAAIDIPDGLSRSPPPMADPWIEIGDDYFLGVWVNELDVETVRKYRLIKS